MDIWDAIEKQEYFSLEAFRHVLAQLSSLSHAPPGLETPPHMVLFKRKDYEVRRCAPSVCACARRAALSLPRHAAPSALRGARITKCTGLVSVGVQTRLGENRGVSRTGV